MDAANVPGYLDVVKKRGEDTTAHEIIEAIRKGVGNLCSQQMPHGATQPEAKVVERSDLEKKLAFARPAAERAANASQRTTKVIERLWDCVRQSDDLITEQALAREALIEINGYSGALSHLVSELESSGNG